MLVKAENIENTYQEEFFIYFKFLKKVLKQDPGKIKMIPLNISKVKKKFSLHF